MDGFNAVTVENLAHDIKQTGLADEMLTRLIEPRNSEKIGDLRDPSGIGEGNGILAEKCPKLVNWDTG
jgi:hypothetical protein